MGESATIVKGSDSAFQKCVKKKDHLIRHSANSCIIRSTKSLDGSAIRAWTSPRGCNQTKKAMIPDSGQSLRHGLIHERARICGDVYGTLLGDGGEMLDLV